MNFIIRICLIAFLFLFNINGYCQSIPEIVSKKRIQKENYLPDFSYAGYHNGEKELPEIQEQIVLASDYGVISDDGLDDSKALIEAINATKKIPGPVVLKLPAGQLILSDILYIERSNFVLRGAGSGIGGTEIFCPRPLLYAKEPEALKELREYLTQFNKRQIEKENNIDLPFSQYAWSGGFIWTQVPGQRVKSYLGSYDVPEKVLAKVTEGERGEKTFYAKDINGLKIGAVVLLKLYNKQGENGPILKDLYKDTNVKIGSHHWNFPNLPLVTQQLEISKISGNLISVKTPLTLSIIPDYQAELVPWKHLKEVGIEDLKISFPEAPRVAHHVEPGYNAIFLTRLHNGWVKNVTINNADSGILTEEVANVSIIDIVTEGKNMAHYTVAMGGTHNILVRNLKVYNEAVHPLSFNTFSTKNVYQNCEVFTSPILDQHSGVNHQNLFDHVKVHIDNKDANEYGLFKGGGAGYWKPSHGAYATFWNIEVQLKKPNDLTNTFILNGMQDGPYARVIGVHGNHKFQIDYQPKAYIEMTNEMPNIESLYDYQLNKRISSK